MAPNPIDMNVLSKLEPDMIHEIYQRLSPKELVLFSSFFHFPISEGEWKDRIISNFGIKHIQDFPKLKTYEQIFSRLYQQRKEFVESLSNGKMLYSNLSKEIAPFSLESMKKHIHLYLDDFRLDRFLESQRFFFQNAPIEYIELLIKNLLYIYNIGNVYSYSFILGASVGRRDVINLLMQPEIFSQIGIEYIGAALHEAVNNRHVDIIDQIIQSDRFNELSIECVSAAVIKAANLRLEHSVNQIFNRKFMDIPAEYLGSVLVKAAVNGLENIVNQLITSERFNEIPIEYIGSAVQRAEENGYENIMIILMHQPVYAALM